MDHVWNKCTGLMIFVDADGVCGAGSVVKGEFAINPILVKHAPNIAETGVEYHLRGAIDDFTPEQCRKIAQYFLDRAAATEEFYNEILHD